MNNPPDSVVTRALYKAEDVKQLDHLAMATHGIAGAVLMKRAGRAAFEHALKFWPEVSRITVFCGTGNNAGDGYVIAALAAQKKIPVQVIQVGNEKKLSADARAAYAYALQENVEFRPFSDCLNLNSGIVIDALLGTGINGAVKEPFAQAIRCINHSQLPVLSVDIPSGLCADTGQILGEVVSATTTVTFIGLKRGLFTGKGPAVSGQLIFSQLGVPEDIYSDVKCDTERLETTALLKNITPRAADAHKGMFGHVMVIGGDHGMGGAALMAAEAALTMGAGLVSVATQPEHVSGLLARRPEIMVTGVSSGQELNPLLSRPSLLVVGPGLGRSAWSEQMLYQALHSGLPLVMDADALNLLGEGRLYKAFPRNDWVLTPHPGEAARLLELTGLSFLGDNSAGNVQAINENRFRAVAELQAAFGGVVVLKGAGSLIKGTDDNISLAYVGNPGMASGGMGDVLSGVIAGLAAQGLNLDVAAKLGVCLHGAAGDIAAENNGQLGLQATELIPVIRKLLNRSISGPEKLIID